tara:strand:- start:3788 stop:4423 length:636 start_codon:yes stop_codon:yes gene_type:complete
MKSFSNFDPVTVNKNSLITQTLQDHYSNTKKLLALKVQSSEYVQSISPKNNLEFKMITRSANSEKSVEFTYSSIKQKISANLISDKERIPVKDNNLPNELTNIKNPEVFYAFVDSVYTKVSKLSDGEYKIDVSVRGLGGESQEDRERKRAMIEAMIDEADRQEIDVVNDREAQSWIDKAWSSVKENAPVILKGLASVATIVSSVMVACNIF